MKPETRFWHWLEEALPSGHYCRVEPPPTPGIPDVNYSILSIPFSIEGWIELKVGGLISNYPFRGIHKGLRQSQRRWTRRRLRERGRVFVFVAIKRDVYIFYGAQALLLNEDTPLSQFHELALAVLPRLANEEFKHQVRYILTEWTPP